MNIEEVIKTELENINKIYLYKEGFFWRAYERSAYRFTKYIRKFQMLKKYIKKVKMDVCYIGFPENMLRVILNAEQVKNSTFLKIKEETKWRICIEIIDASKIEPSQEFETYKQNYINPATKDEKWFIKQLRDYPVFKKTPLETVEFVATLQEKLRSIKP